MHDERLIEEIRKLYKPQRASDDFFDALYARASQEFMQNIGGRKKASYMFWFLRAGVFAISILAIVGSYSVINTMNKAPDQIPVVKEEHPTTSPLVWNKVNDIEALKIFERDFDGRGGGGEEEPVNLTRVYVSSEQEEVGIVYRLTKTDIPREVKELFQRMEVYQGEEYEQKKDGFVFSLLDETEWRSLRFEREAGVIAGTPITTAEEMRIAAHTFLNKYRINFEFLLEEKTEQYEDGTWITWYTVRGVDEKRISRHVAVVTGDAWGVQRGWIEIFGDERAYQEIALLPQEEAIMRAQTLGYFGTDKIEIETSEYKEGACTIEGSVDIAAGREDEAIFGPFYDIICNGKMRYRIPAWSD